MKQILITDTHFGTHQNSIKWCNSMVNLFTNELPAHLTENTEIIHCGDFFDSRSTLNVYVLDTVIKALDVLNRKLFATNSKMYIVCGNHDYYSPNADDRSAIALFEDNWSNIVVIAQDYLVKSYEDGTTYALVPWYSFINDLDSILDEGVRTIFTHTDLEHLDAETKDKLKGVNIYSGHIHQEYKEHNWINLGSTFSLDFNNANRVPCFYILENNELEKVPTECSFRFYKYYDIEKAKQNMDKWTPADFIRFTIPISQYSTNTDFINDLRNTYSNFSIIITQEDSTEVVADTNKAKSVEEIMLELIPKELHPKANLLLLANT